MSGRVSGKTHVAATLFAIASIPVVYLLSVAPISGSVEDRDAAWVKAYRVPYDWLDKNTPLRIGFSRYESWWWDMAVMIHENRSRRDPGGIPPQSGKP
jgi:hypothetical protein